MFDSFAEFATQASYLTQAVTIPVISDADTGFGEALSVERTVHEFERAGLAGLHLEDQVLPKLSAATAFENDSAIAAILNAPGATEENGAIALDAYTDQLIRLGGLSTIIVAAKSGSLVADVALKTIETARSMGIARMDFSLATVRAQHEALVASGAMTQQTYDALLAAAKRRLGEAERLLGRSVSAAEVSVALRYGLAFPKPEGA